MRIFQRNNLVLVTVLVAFTASCASQSLGGRQHESKAWWDSPGFREFRSRMVTLHASVDYPALEDLYREAERYARKAGNSEARLSYLTALGNTQSILFHYRDAIESYRAAMQLAKESGDAEAAAAITVGLSSVYFEVGDIAAAREAAAEGLRYLEKVRFQPGYQPFFEGALKLQYARIVATENEAVNAAVAAIEAMRSQPPALGESPNTTRERFESEAEAWSLLGEAHLNNGDNGDLEAAEDAIVEGFRLRRLAAPEKLYRSYWRLGRLRLTQGTRATEEKLLLQAERFTTLALESALEAGAHVVSFSALLQRALVRQKQGEHEAALEDFATAASFASRWRVSVPNAESTLSSADDFLHQHVFREYAAAAAAQAIRTGEPKWIAASLIAAEQNRAASLRQSKALAPIWRDKMPEEYWATLAQLRREEGAKMLSGGGASRSERLHLELTKMESSSVLENTDFSENFRAGKALKQLHEVLRDDQILLSIQMGRQRSYLWSVTRTSLRIYELSGGEGIEKDVARFRELIREGGPERDKVGAKLYHSLFGQLSARETEKTSWLLSLDGPLFELPFAALRDTITERDSAYLIERHALQIVPGAFLLGKREAVDGTGIDIRGNSGSQGRGNVTKKTTNDSPSVGYVGFGDPIYSAADPRYRTLSHSLLSKSDQTPRGLNRLVASAEEVEQSAEAWRKRTEGARAASVFKGAAASRETLLGVLNGAIPSTIHFATHILSGDTYREQAFLALSAQPGRGPDLLATSDVARLYAPGVLVVMAGCTSATGDVAPGAGILGMTRAWLIAGASAVVATQWPIEDAVGGLVPAFYRHLSGSTAAEALRSSQIEMLHTSNWQSNPAYWAAYQITGVAQ